MCANATIDYITAYFPYKTFTKIAPADLTWSNFKKHFTDVHTNQIKVRRVSMANTPYKQTNDAINKLTQEFAEMCSEL